MARLEDEPGAALADFRQALELNPQSRGALQNIAHVLAERLGDTQAAVAVMNELVRLAPDNAKTLASRGVLLGRLSQRAAALADAEAALAISQEPDTLYQVSGIYALTSQCERSDAQRAMVLLSSGR